MRGTWLGDEAKNERIYLKENGALCQKAPKGHLSITEVRQN